MSPLIHETHCYKPTEIMADVEMQDATPAAAEKAKAKAIAKTAKAGGTETPTDNKKRFEVKKVRSSSSELMFTLT